MIYSLHECQLFRDRQTNPRLDTDETIVVLQMGAIRIIFVMRL